MAAPLQWNYIVIILPVILCGFQIPSVKHSKAAWTADALLWGHRLSKENLEYVSRAYAYV